MLSLSLSSSPLSYNYAARIKSPNSSQGRAFCRVSSQLQQLRQRQPLNRFSYNPLRVSVMTMKGRGFGAVCYSSPIAPAKLQWISAISTAVLMLARGTAIHKSFLVPLFALQAPGSIVSWMKGEYGMWTAFLGLLVRLFFYIPGQLELPFITFLLVIVAPHQILRLRNPRRCYSFIGNSCLSGFPAFLQSGQLVKIF